MKAPDFWRKGGAHLPAFCLAPMGMIYAIAAEFRWKYAKSTRVSIPVICVGNAVMGGAGKTPVAEALARHLAREGWTPHFLSRGYGGALAGRDAAPIRVDLSLHAAHDVGDEPLMLAATAPTWVTPDRVRGALAAESAGADILIMDDGYQNPALEKDINILVVDGAYGFGNGLAFPAGPLRETPESALSRAHAVVLFEPDRNEVGGRIPSGLPVHSARLTSRVPPTLAPGQPVLAFCGIGRPEKFFDAVRDQRLVILETRAFPDHHPYDETVLNELAERARSLDATLVTTEKDAVRIDGARHPGIVSIGAEVEFADEDAVARILAPVTEPDALPFQD